jgi:hypothetical protein
VGGFDVDFDACGVYISLCFLLQKHASLRSASPDRLPCRISCSVDCIVFYGIRVVLPLLYNLSGVLSAVRICHRSSWRML